MRRFRMVLVDLSPGMLAVSRWLNPECEHVEGDMRTVRLGRQFDCVFVHDAIVYMTTEADLQKAIETAFVHCRPGGATLFAPDHTVHTTKNERSVGCTVVVPLMQATPDYSKLNEWVTVRER